MKERAAPRDRVRRLRPIVSALVGGSALAVVACADAPPPAPIAPAPPPRALTAPPGFEPVVRACVFITSGATGEEIRREDRDLSSCVDFVTRLGSLPRGACLVAARGAAEVDACLGRPTQVADATRLCAARPGESAFCLGRAVVTCGESPSLVACAPSERCAETRLATGVVVRGCAADCRPDAPSVQCVNGDVVRCAPGMPAERTSCPLGTRCVETRGEGGDVDAVCERAPCVPGRARCDGSRLESCVADEAGHGSLVVSDCATFGLSCMSEGTRAACVATDAPTCERGPGFCEGDVLRACPAGFPVRIRCGAYGLGACRVGADGIASCAPPVPRAGNVR